MAWISSPLKAMRLAVIGDSTQVPTGEIFQTYEFGARGCSDLADPEWKSMILFGLYTGQRLADVATVPGVT
jgi:hypothetical protein